MMLTGSPKSAREPLELVHSQTLPSMSYTGHPDHLIGCQTRARAAGRLVWLCTGRQGEDQAGRKPAASHHASGIRAMASLSRRRTTALAASTGSS